MTLNQNQTETQELDTGAAFDAAFAKIVKEEAGEAAADDQQTPAQQAQSDDAATGAKGAGDQGGADAEGSDQNAGSAEGDAAPAAEADDTAGKEGEGAAVSGGAKPAAPAPAAGGAQNNRQDDPVARLADMLADRVAPRPAQTAPQPQPEQQPQLYSSEEAAILNRFAEDYPDVMQAQTLILRGQQQLLTNFIFSEVAKVLGPLQRQQEAIATQIHLASLQQNIEGYSDQLVDEVAAWVDKQPRILKEAYLKAMNEGDEQDIADLVTAYRKDTGTAAAPAGNQQPQQTPPQQRTELPERARQAAKALAPVGGKRTTMTVQPDPQDFDTAFAAAAKAL